MQFNVTGSSSGKVKTIIFSKDDEGINMLKFMTEKSFPIASSCRGEKVCTLCTVNHKTLLCAYTVKEFYSQFGSEIVISYL